MIVDLTFTLNEGRRNAMIMPRIINIGKRWIGGSSDRRDVDGDRSFTREERTSASSPTKRAIIASSDFGYLRNMV